MKIFTVHLHTFDTGNAHNDKVVHPSTNDILP